MVEARPSVSVTTFGELFKAARDGQSKARAPADQYRALEAITQHCELDGGITTECLARLRAKVVLQHLTRPIVNLMTLADFCVALQIPPAEIQDDERDYLVERCRSAQKAIGLHAELRNPNGIRKLVNERWAHAQDAGAVGTVSRRGVPADRRACTRLTEQPRRFSRSPGAGAAEWVALRPDTHTQPPHTVRPSSAEGPGLRQSRAVKTSVPELSLPSQVPAKEAIGQLKRQALQVTAGINEWARSQRPEKPGRLDKPRRMRGRPVDTDAKADEHLYAAWLSPDYRTYAELARELDKPEREVKRAIDRHRKRMERREE